jgi:prepilin-type N-terminal cleavage/methylation domain-containing protein
MPSSTADSIVSKSKESGMSLVESLIVILIIASVAAFTLPAVGTMVRAYNLRSTATHIAERLTAARALAMMKNENVTFSFNKANGHYGFDFTSATGTPGVTTPGPDGDPDTVDPDQPAVGYYWEVLPSGMTMTYPNNTDIKVTFNSRGELPILETEHSIAIQSAGRTSTLRVNLRGKVWVE